MIRFKKPEVIMNEEFFYDPDENDKLEEFRVYMQSATSATILQMQQAAEAFRELGRALVETAKIHAENINGINNIKRE